VGVVGYVVTTRAIRSDRNAAAERNALAYSVRLQGVLAQAEAVVAGLGNVLGGERTPSESTFRSLANATAASVGLPDALWVQRVPFADRARYERRIRAPITRLTSSGLRTAGPAASYLSATFTTESRPELRSGVDVSDWPALLASIDDRTRIFAVSASRLGALGDQSGFFILEDSAFGPRRGYLVVFVPKGWLLFELAVDPRQLAISLDGQRLEGGLPEAPAKSDRFQVLGRTWRVEVGPALATSLQGLLPWFALTWPAAVALLAFVVARGVSGRRRAERDLERFFALSLDMMCVVGLDGYFKRVNDAFERTLGYSAEELRSWPYVEFVHPDDRAPTLGVADALAQGREVVEFENRYVRKDGGVRWLEWSARSAPSEALIYAAARDVTERKHLEDEQAALRRVATAVARGGSPDDIFAATVAELHTAVAADSTALMRYEVDESGTLLAALGERPFEVGSRIPLIGDSLTAEVRRTGCTARVDDFEHACGPIAERMRASGLRSSVGAPIVVEGRLWGVMASAWTGASPPPDAEDRVAQFTDLVGIAIANAESRAELFASRARIVTTADQTRRRIERDLHDGAQQRLVTMTMKLRQLETGTARDAVTSEITAIAAGLDDVLDELREAAQGLHPVILSRGGLAPALKTLARRSPVPVELDVRTLERLPEPVEVAAYYVVAEALTNAAKHAQASVVRVDAEVLDGDLRVSVQDDGLGGADSASGSGLVGLIDRVEALGGKLTLNSPRGGGTTLRIDLPLSG
jgi:PAS domain S-box-containing protein